MAEYLKLHETAQTTAPIQELRGPALRAYFETMRREHVAQHGSTTADEAVARIRAIRDGGSLEPRAIKARARRIAKAR